MKVFVPCEFSGIVTANFRKRGHDAFSCDLLPTEGNKKWHMQGDCLKHLNDGWDLMIAFPPCTHLAVSGAAWFKEKIADGRQQQAIDFFMKLVNSPIEKICVENPVCIMSTKYRKPDQIIQPWQYGHPETKTTCLWLKNLPKLIPTNIVNLPKEKNKRMRLHYLPPSENRWKLRSITFQGIADAMATQWP